MVDAVICEWEHLLAIRRIPLREIRTRIAIFYSNDGLIASRNPETLQKAIDLLTGLFDRVGLQTNIRKTEVIIFMPGNIWIFLTDMAYRPRMAKDFRGEGKRRKVDCSECCKKLVVGSLAGHLAKKHDVY